MEKIKLLSYNIMSGCFENYTQGSVLTGRFDLLQKAIKAIGADFVGLVDTFKWKETFSETELKKKFNYKHVFMVDMEDTRVEKNIGVAVMTNLDVRGFTVVRAYNRNYIETVLNNLNVYTCYFDDISEDTRLSEVNSLLSQVKKPAIIHGDLNTLAKDDLELTEKVGDVFERENIELAKRLKPAFDGMKLGKVVETLKTNGFIDVEKKWGPTFPTKLFPAVVTEPFVRVDYFFHTKNIIVKETVVERGNLFDKVSDHYPLSAIVNC